MLLSQPSVDVTEHNQFGSHCIEFAFKGKFNERDCLKATAIWKKTFDKAGNQKFIVIWNCEKMTGFELAARREWIKHMQILSNRIEKVLVVCDNTVIRGSARLMLKLFPFKSEVVKSYDKLLAKYSAVPATN